MVVIKPNFISGILQKKINNDTYSINIIGNTMSVKTTNIIPVKLPFYKKDQYV